MMPTIDDFNQLDIRVGKVLKVEDPPEDVKKRVFKLTIDFGPEIGEKVSLAGFTKHYQKADLEGRLVLGVVNFPPRTLGSAVSEVLTLGVDSPEGEAVLVIPDPNLDVPLGRRLH